MLPARVNGCGSAFLYASECTDLSLAEQEVT